MYCIYCGSTVYWVFLGPKITHRRIAFLQFCLAARFAILITTITSCGKSTTWHQKASSRVSKSCCTERGNRKKLWMFLTIQGGFEVVWFSFSGGNTII
ncbi:hypothetical protein B0H12DRAFT_1107012 [Mycena haematopus]|nr:hypothetical protein B0H12DRAFT_1107012 [Mycena haematopus]